MKDKTTNILGVKISTLTYSDTLELINKWLTEKWICRVIVTPNPEFLVKAQKDAEFKRILNSADLAIADGSKLIWASKNKIFERVSGTDLMISLCGVCLEKSLSVGLIGGGEKIAVKTAECLLKQFPGLKIKTFEIGVIPSEVEESSEHVKTLLLTRDPSTSPAFGEAPLRMTKGVDVLFVALGMGKQERWIYNNREMLKKSGVRLAMGVGGAFDYISGAVPRAPKFMRDYGLEWLFRLLVQPWRLKRQLALLEFVYLIFKERRGRMRV